MAVKEIINPYREYSITKQMHYYLMLVVSLLFSSFIFYNYYDLFWYPPDDGAYAYVADRILAGDVLNLDIQDIHMGYINFFNAAALKVFGNNIASLRIPLIITGLLQSIIIFRFFIQKGLLVSFLASVSITVFSFILFPNPTANWYALFWTIVVIACLEWIPNNYKYKIPIIGFLVMTIFLFRQLSGVIVAIGIVTFLLFQNHEKTHFKNSIISRVLYLIMLVGLSGYLYSKTSISSIILYGIFPLGILMVGLLKITVDNRKSIKILTHLFLGALLALIPIIAYHIYHGSVSTWYSDTVLSALSLTELSFMQMVSFIDYIFYSLYFLIENPSLDIYANSFLWICLVLVIPVMGAMVFHHIYKNMDNLKTVSPLLIIGLFFSLVTIHYQIPIYLYYGIGLTICIILWLSAEFKNVIKKIVWAVTGTLSALILYYHAGQPINRTLDEIIQGKSNLSEKTFIEGKFNLWLETNDANQYQYFIELTSSKLSSSDKIFAFPSNAEIYYLTNRKNPFRFFNSAFGIRNQDQLNDVISKLITDPPGIIFYTPDDKYNTSYSLEIAKYVAANYELYETYDRIEIYIRKDIL